jgi:hypothetical protein
MSRSPPARYKAAATSSCVCSSLTQVLALVQESGWACNTGSTRTKLQVRTTEVTHVSRYESSACCHTVYWLHAGAGAQWLARHRLQQALPTGCGAITLEQMKHVCNSYSHRGRDWHRDCDVDLQHTYRTGKQAGMQACMQAGRKDIHMFDFALPQQFHHHTHKLDVCIGSYTSTAAHSCP